MMSAAQVVSVAQLTKAAGRSKEEKKKKKGEIKIYILCLDIATSSNCYIHKGFLKKPTLLARVYLI